LLGSKLKQLPARNGSRKSVSPRWCGATAVMTPHGDTTFLVGDDVYFAGEPDAVSVFMQWGVAGNRSASSAR
jgi:Trk K+ transport system NAD-binding subunit